MLGILYLTDGTINEVSPVIDYQASELGKILASH